MVIVGAGKAAARAVVGLREHGWQGSVTLIGEETLPPYDRPPLSKSAIAEEGEPSPVILIDDETLASLQVTRIGGVAATAIDRAARCVSLADGRSLPYAKLLLCTGARARRLTLPGAERALTLRDFPDVAPLRAAFVPGRSIAIVGGGFIGLELASSAAKRGCRVVLIEALPRILMRGVPEEISRIVADRHARAGVEIVTNARIERIDAGSVLLAGGRCVPADTVIAGIGAAPEISLGAAAGLAIDNGIACDGHMRSSDPDIYAVGDCCSFPHPVFGGRRMRLEAWRAAQDQAAVATANMAGGDRIFDAVPWFWSDQYELNLQIAGLPGDGTSSVTRQVKEGAVIIFHLDAQGVLVGASGIGPGNSIARDVRMAELLIARRAAPDPAQLADPAVLLKSLIKP